MPRITLHPNGVHNINVTIPRLSVENENPEPAADVEVTYNGQTITKRIGAGATSKFLYTQTDPPIVVTNRSTVTVVVIY